MCTQDWWLVGAAILQKNRNRRKEKKGNKGGTEEGKGGKGGKGGEGGKGGISKLILNCSAPVLNSLLHLVYSPETIHYKCCISFSTTA